MSASEPDTRGTPFVPAWVAVMAVGLLTGLQPLSTDLYLPALPEMQRALSLTSPQVQWTLSVLILAFGIGQLVWGPVSDRWGRRPGLCLSRRLLRRSSSRLQRTGLASPKAVKRAQLRAGYRPYGVG